MGENPEEGRPVKVKFSDKRKRVDDPAAEEDAASTDSPSPDLIEAESEDYLEDLRRVQADFENYRKRMLREQTQLAQRASARLVERLLPILDNFESAISHGEGGAGVELVYRELKKLLEDEGLQEIDAEGRAFDPTEHEAFEAIEDPSVEHPTVRSVLRRGYTLKGQVLRPSMVSVARPPDEEDSEQTDEDGSDTSEPDAAEG